MKPPPQELHPMRPSALINYTLDGLKRCYMSEQGLWSYKYHLDGRRQSNETRPAYDAFYSLNVLLGLSKVSKAVQSRLGVDPHATFEKAVAQIGRGGAPLYAYGMALWTAEANDLPVPPWLEGRIRTITADARSIERWKAQEIGMLLTGMVAQARIDPSWEPIARRARDHVLARLWVRSGLFRDCAFGARRYFATFASQVYCTLGLYHYGTAFDDAEALEAADLCVKKLISLQGPNGEWPWFYHVESGRIVDFYEVYSVHQHGMAPAILKPAMARGVAGAEEAISKGFTWILGQNELGCSMLRPELSLIARSQARQGLKAARLMRASRAAFNTLTGRPARLCGGPSDLTITPEVRSYELGWTLWSFGDDSDFPALTNHSVFGGADVCAPRQPVGFESCRTHVAPSAAQNV